MNAEIKMQPTRALVIAAFAVIYVVWGSTYLAIRVTVETLPAFLSAGVRFLIAGGIMFAFLAARGAAKPSFVQWRYAMVTGTLMLVGGNGLVVWAERTLSSGFTALLVALAPVWFALLDWLRPQGVRPQLKTIFGIILGFIGVTLLVKARGTHTGFEGQWGATFAIITAGICWAGGSLYAKYKPNAGSPWITAAAQMICGGVALSIVGILLGEPFSTDWRAVSGRSLTALGYLIVFGSWIGFTAYVWLLRVSTPARISTYAYVNPVIAVGLGWLLLDEKVTAGMLGGAAVILVGVVIITVPPGLALSAGQRVVQRLFGWATLP
jgi:drug/metabolite transporter (DMT)-like permease